MKYLFLLLPLLAISARAADAPPLAGNPVNAPAGPANCLPWPPGSGTTPTPCGQTPDASNCVYTPSAKDDRATVTVTHCKVAEDRSWHLMSVTYGGTVTLLKGLTHHEAEFMYDRLMGLPATAKEKADAAAAEKASDQRYAAQKKTATAACSLGDNSKEWKAYSASSNDRDVRFFCDGKAIGGEASGGGSTVGLHLIEPGDIKSAEIFQ